MKSTLLNFKKKKITLKFLDASKFSCQGHLESSIDRSSTLHSWLSTFFSSLDFIKVKLFKTREIQIHARESNFLINPQCLASERFMVHGNVYKIHIQVEKFLYENIQETGTDRIKTNCTQKMANLTGKQNREW